jgi:glycosyltransferase involved in cell wall biosynthesis
VDAAALERQHKQLHRHWLTERRGASPDTFRALYDLGRIWPKENDRKSNIVMAAYALGAGGGEVFPIVLANLLKARGYAVTLLNCNQQPTDSGIRAMLDRTIPLLQIEMFESLDVVLADLGAEIVHSHHAWVDMSLSMQLVHRPEIRHVITMHGMYEMMTEAHLKKFLPILERTIDCFVYSAEKNLLPFPESMRLRNDFVRINNALPASKIIPIPRHQLGLKPDDFVLCFVSRAIPEKGWEEAINAVIIANMNSNRCIHLLLIGDGPEFDRLRQKHAIEYIHFLGFRSNIRDYFSTSDLGFLPSRFRGESFPLVMIDCLRAGKPVLASNIGEIAQMLSTRDGLAGELFDLDDWRIPEQRVADLIIRLAHDEDYYQSLLARAPDAATKFDPVSMVDDYEEVYRRCCDRHLYRVKEAPCGV